MRIISGSRRGQKLIPFEGRDVRPTTDRVKESIFNIISPFVADARVLDLFAGSGALSMEALSRGAEYACCVDIDKRSIDIIKRNIGDLRYDAQSRVIHSSYEGFLKSNNERFDIIFLDPPYNKGFIKPLLDSILKTETLSPGGIVVLESDETDFRGAADGYSIYRQRKYGRTYITIYTNAEGQKNEHSGLSGQF